MPGRKYLFIIIILSVFIFSELWSDEIILSQKQDKIINANPDPNGTPWIAGGYPVLTGEMQQEIESLPEFVFSAKRNVLPHKVNNAEEKYFRPVFTQQGASSGQASGIGYQFTYEMCFERDISAANEREQFPSHFIWHFLNRGNGNIGSLAIEGWNIINGNGCPTLEDFGGMEGGDVTSTIWMSGYEKYLNGMKHKITEIRRIKVNTENGLKTLKQFLFDHGDGSKVGGLANFSVRIIDSATGEVYMEKLPRESQDSGMFVIPRWGNTGTHSMTIVGYNDSIKYDYNGDGQFTNDKDINGDGKVDMKDWEIGALIIANSWGKKWPDSFHKGFIYMMYKLCAEHQDSKECGIGMYNNVICIRVSDKYKPELTYKITFQHDSREKVQLLAGISHDLKAGEPEEMIHFPIFNFQGGDFPLGGESRKKEMEIGLDITPLKKSINHNEIKFFLIINSLGGSGKVNSFALLDYRDKDVIEQTGDEKDVEIKKGKTIVSLVYKSRIEELTITTKELPEAKCDEEYKAVFEASGGKKPYKWKIKENVYEYKKSMVDFPLVEKNVLKLHNADDGFVKQELGFKFPFYGENYEKVYISTDGSILFSDNFRYIRNRASLLVNKAITALGGDLIFDQDGDAIYYEGNDQEAKFRWSTTRFSRREEDVKIDFCAKLFKSGAIQFFYNSDMTDGITGLAHGISAGTGNDYHILDFETTSDIIDEASILFSPQKMPEGMTFTEDGILQGTPKAKDKNKSWNLVVVCTDAEGMSKSRNMKFKIDEVPIIAKKTVNTPTRFRLSMQKNMPVIFSFNTKYDQLVSLEIFNGLGKKIRTLVNRYKKAGAQKAVWNVTDSDGKHVPCGIYIGKLAVNNEKYLKKVILVK
jgi:hypothetical protein